MRILAEEGLWNGLMKGMMATILREVPCYAAQFGSYYLTKDAFARRRGVTHQELGAPELFVAGGVGGFFCWFFSYPQDVIKTRLQVARSSEFGKHQTRFGLILPDGGVIACGKAIHQHEGWQGFWRGFSACTARAIFANSFMFMSYEYARKWYKQYLE